MTVADLVGRHLVAHGVDHVFGVVGSGNFHLTNAMVAAGARFVATAHEGGAATMADAYARVSGRPAALTVHQGPGVTNSLTGLTEAAKSRTPLVVLAPEATSPRSNFYIDVPGLAAAIGASYVRVRAEHAASDVAAAHRLATAGAGATVLLGLPLDVQGQPVDGAPPVVAPEPAPPAAPDVTALVEALAASRRPVFIAGRGATRPAAPARDAIAAVAERCGAVLAVSAVAKGLFAGDPWYLDVCGGFATPLTAELVGGADLVVGWGSTLNMWTTRHGRLVPAHATVAQVDLDPDRLGVNHRVDIGVAGDVTAVARACLSGLGTTATGWRTPELAARIKAEGRWRAVSYVDEGGGGKIDPRTLSIGLDDVLPAERTLVIDSGNFMGYPSMFMSVPDCSAFLFTQAFQSIGLGLAGALGAAVARPDRVTVAALGDGGFLMGAAELVTAASIGSPLLIVVYNDAAYGAEVHHFGPDGYVLDTVRFPDQDLAAIGRGYGCDGVTVRSADDLAAVGSWLAGSRERPLVVDAKVVSEHGSWWLEEAFRGH